MLDYERRLWIAQESNGTHRARQSGTKEWRAMRAESGAADGKPFAIGTAHSQSSDQASSQR
jgi:hypothetical protein